MERYICIHGHFYQPPRDNPWLEHVELQDSAYPHHDWNERITAECYAPNTASRLLNSKQRITRLVNNYAKISFDFGPTLLAWMEKNAPEVYKAILEADQASQRNFSGHGSALAQAYNHVILPLANHHDKYTQVLWGIKDFEHRFQRKPEGMWLPETAVDLETLEVLAELGMKFTILAPHQARRVRQIGTKTWEVVSGGNIDPTMAYELPLPSGRKLNLFFYNAPIARAVAFEGLLASGERFAQRLISAFSSTRRGSQLVHIATDGETYGHHYRFGDMALSYALDYIETNGLAQITNYGEFLEKYPPTHEVEIVENTSWGCAHGIERWRSNCGCSAGGHPGWNQAWRAPLRRALDWLCNSVASKYKEQARQFLKEPRAARNEYIEVILNRSPENVRQLLSRHTTRELNEAERITVLKLLELQRHAMLMYTSCGWFFDDLSRIETVQILHYAGRVVQLAEELSGDDIERHFLKLLELTKSNIPEWGDGRRIYEKLVKPARVDLTKVAIHLAVNSLFEEYTKKARVYCYTTDLEDYHSYFNGKAKLAVGQAKIASEITGESTVVSFGAIRFTDHNVNAGIREYQGEEAYQAMVQEVTQTFSWADFPGVLQLLDKHFGTTYSLESLFWDEQRQALERILESTLSGIEEAYHQLYQRHFSPRRLLPGSLAPKPLQAAAGLILNAPLRRALRGDTLEVERVRGLLDEAREWKSELDTEGLGYAFKQSLEKMMAKFASTPGDIALLNNLVAVVKLARSAPFAVDLWKVQNLYYEVLGTTYPEFQKKAEHGDEAAREWTAQFVSLGELLSIRV